MAEEKDSTLGSMTFHPTLPGMPAPARPSYKDKYVQDRVLETFMPQVETYLGDDWDGYNDKEKEGVREDIRSILFSYKDAYQLARDLERKGWEGDRALVDVLDELNWEEVKAIRELTKEWVKTYSIKIPFEENAMVLVTHKHHQLKGKIGRVANMYHEDADIGIVLPEDEGRADHLAYVFHAEDVELVKEEAAAA